MTARRPLHLGPASSDEYAPLDPGPVVREAERRAADMIDAEARRHGIARRDFLRTAGASAIVLASLAACTDESRRARSETSAAGTFDVDETTTSDLDVAAQAFDADGFVMDVQTHFLDPDRNAGAFGRRFPQAACGEDDWKRCFARDRYLDLVFADSATTVAVLSALPIVDGDSPLATEVMHDAIEKAAEEGRGGRVLMQAPVFPATGPLGAALDQMSAVAAALPVRAWKTYTHSPDVYRLDDPRGEAMIARAVELGIPRISVHKGLAGGSAASSPEDVGPAAAAHRDVTFVVYHSGWESSVTETGTTDGDGVDRLIRSVESAGIGPGGNVYAELGTTWFNLSRDPEQAGHVLGKLLRTLGPERILWGTDSIWYGSPQGQIDAFRAFTIRDEARERYGYPALDDAAKARILGLNAAELYGVPVT